MPCLQFARCFVHCSSLVFQLCGKHCRRTNMLRPTFYKHNGDSHTTSAAHIRSINVLRNYFYLHTYWLHLLSEFWTQSSSVKSQLTCRSKLLSIRNRCPTDCELVPVVFFSCPDLCRRRSRVSPKSYLVGKYAAFVQTDMKQCRLCTPVLFHVFLYFDTKNRKEISS